MSQPARQKVSSDTQKQLIDFLKTKTKEQKCQRVAPYFPCTDKAASNRCACPGWKTGGGQVPNQFDRCARDGCGHSLKNHGDLLSIPTAELDRRLIMVTRIEKLWNQSQQTTLSDAQKQEFYQKIRQLRMHLYRPPPAKQVCRAMLSEPVGNRRAGEECGQPAPCRMHPAQAPRQPVVRNTPPFEVPVISKILRNFFDLRFSSERDTHTRHNVEKLCKGLLGEVNRLVLPEPQEHAQRFPNDRHYAQNYQRWKFYCVTAQGADKKKAGDIFGQTFLQSVLQLAVESVLTNLSLPDEMVPLVSGYFKTLMEEVQNDQSIIFREDFEHVRHTMRDSSSLLSVGGKRKRDTDDSSAGPPIKRKRKGIKVPPPPTGISLQSVFGEEILKDKEGEDDHARPYVMRDETAKAEEEAGTIAFAPIMNDGTEDSFVALVSLKCIFSAQLPKMPRDYIMRTCLDRKHRALALIKHGRVIGGILYRPFLDQGGEGFAEIVFCAVDGKEQVKGYGSHMMNHLKDYVRKHGIACFLTYADNFAVGYFRKQGFHATITLPRERWAGYIKDYDGGTLMECRFNPRVDHLRIPIMVQRQRRTINEAIRRCSRSHVIYPGLASFQPGGSGAPQDIRTIRGVKEAGWVPSHDIEKLHVRLGAILEAVKGNQDAWPFKEPVDAKEVPDYRKVIKHPMDLQTMSHKLAKGTQYVTKELFTADMMKIFSNCRLYNAPNTNYYECADKLEAFFKSFILKTF